MSSRPDVGASLDELERRELLLEELLPVVDTESSDRVVARLQTLHPADQADFLEELAPAKRQELVGLYDQEGLADLLEFFNESARTEILESLDPDVLSGVLVLIDEDLAADLVEELPDERVHEILSRLDAPTSNTITDILFLGLVQRRDEAWALIDGTRGAIDRLNKE